MSLLSLPRVKKLLQSPKKQERQAAEVVVKQEPLATNIEEEPKSCGNLLSSIVKKEPLSEKEQKLPTEELTCLLRTTKKSESTIARKRTSAFQPLNISKKRITLGSLKTTDFKKAVRVFSVLSAKDSDSLSDKELDYLTWAESVIVKETFRRNKNAATTIDCEEDSFCDTSESVTCEELLEENDLIEPAEVEKNQNTKPTRVNSREITDTLELAVVDFGKPGGRYTFQNGLLIKNALGKLVVEYVLQNHLPTPKFGRGSWHDGVVVLDCKDHFSYEFAKKAVSEMKLWKRSILRAIRPEKIPFMSKGRLYVPDFKIGHDELLEVLQSQNPSVNVTNWRILEEDDFLENGLKRYTLMIPNPPIVLFENKRMELFFGSTEVTLKLLVCNGIDEI